VIDTEREEVTRELGEALGGSGEGQLELTGAEVLGFLALKVAVPVVASFISRELWERYNRMRTRAQARRAEEELKDAAVVEPAVAEADVVRAVADSLRDEGVPGEVAERVAERAYARVARRVGEQPVG
jgi:hypothetical protein